MIDYCSGLPVLSPREVESIIVDTIECEAEDYQCFDWAPVSAAIKAIHARAFEKRPPGTTCRGCGTCWPSHSNNPANRPTDTSRAANSTASSKRSEGDE